jgi:hypothetical protein
LLLVFALPAWLTTSRTLFRGMVGILSGVVVLCAAVLLVTKIWMVG